MAAPHTRNHTSVEWHRKGKQSLPYKLVDEVVVSCFAVDTKHAFKGTVAQSFQHLFFASTKSFPVHRTG
jgi:hypothetical protein